MTVSELVTSSGRQIQVTGKGYKPSGDFLLAGRKIDPKHDQELSLLLQASILCNNASLSTQGIIGDPTEGALVVMSAKAGMDKTSLEAAQKLESEIPFSSERKMMTTIRKSGRGMLAYTKGAPEVVLARCAKILHGSMVKTLTPTLRKSILEANSAMASRALRVLAVAYKKSDGCSKDAEKDMIFLGLVGMMDPARDEVADAIKLCKKAGIASVMITGDNPSTARAVASQLGLFSEGDEVVTGQELEAMSEAELVKRVNKIKVFARVSPTHKMRIVEALRKNGHVIAMTGDGVNDAPALKHADIGIAMGIKGTEVAKGASDMVLKDDNFTTIVAAVREGRTIYDNIKKFMLYMLSSNLGEVFTLFFAILIGFTDPATGMLILPLTAIQLLWINIMTDGLPAIALGVDPPAPYIMDVPPRNPKTSILNRETVFDMIFIGLVICAGTLIVFWFNLDQGEAVATTAAFTTIVVLEMVKLMIIRMKYGMGFFSNMKLIYAMIVSMALQLAVVYVPFLQSAFNTTPLGLIDWLKILGVSVVLMSVSGIWFSRIHRNGRNNENRRQNHQKGGHKS
jgi:Ca2+-transporting ATPase